MFRSAVSNRFLTYQVLESRRMLAIGPGAVAETFLGTELADVFVVRQNLVNSNIVEFEINGLVEQVDTTLVDEVILSAMGGDDTLLIDTANGDPTAVLPFTFRGGMGTDLVEIETVRNVEFRIKHVDDPDDGDDLIAEPDGFLRVLAPGTECITLFDIESFVSGSGNDLFFFPTVGLLSDFTGNISVDAGSGINRLMTAVHSGFEGINISIHAGHIEGYFDGELQYAATGGVFFEGEEIRRIAPGRGAHRDRARQ